MRLNPDQIEAIKQETENYFGAQAEVWLFGSRVDDTAKGGDIDLYVRPGTGDADQLAAARFAFLARLKRRIGDRKIDLVLQRSGGEELPIHELARQLGVKL
ncbi:MAG: hypothetical protein A2V79_07070 [Betaproteobacteria bacterium RBG_16_56_24]|nr:MAG: hypothetical protein A2V79_07070 [Betaproteobacteria bacterium RBG_16_56_24]